MKVVRHISIKFYVMISVLLMSIAPSIVLAQEESPFGDILPDQTDATLDSTLGSIVQWIVSIGGLAVAAGGLIYGGIHILQKVKEANSSKEGAGLVLGAIAMSLVVILVTGVIGGVLILGSEPAGELVAGVFGG